MINLSTDPETTTKALNFYDTDLTVRVGTQGSLELRKQVAKLYTGSDVQVTPDDVIIANATTGANLLSFQSQLSPGDHVICMYPCYEPLFQIPKQLGASMTYWRLDPSNNWEASLADLKTLIRPNTKMLIVNNPHNPTGTLLSASAQQAILHLAAQHNITVHSDEIFRPLFHSSDIPAPPSLLQHAAYDNVIATGSVSKAFCLSAVRIGWCVTRNPELKASLLSLRQWTLESTSLIDERIAAEALSDRCRDPILARLHAFAHRNLAELHAFLAKHQGAVAATVPTGGATAFVKFMDPASGRAVDDLQFCQALMKDTGVLLSPASLCFSQLQPGDFTGYTRLHFTCKTEIFKEGLRRIGEFLNSPTYSALSAGGQTNGTH